jgi:hypothetical protein
MKKKNLKDSDVSRNWWNSKNEDEQMFLMLKYGYNSPFKPERVKVEEMVKMYNAEHSS